MAGGRGDAAEIAVAAAAAAASLRSCAFAIACCAAGEGEGILPVRAECHEFILLRDQPLHEDVSDTELHWHAQRSRPLL